MPQTLSFSLVHVIFSTKDRQPLIPDAIADTLHAYLAGAAPKLDCEYIETQKAHHRKRDFQDQMRALYAKYHVVFR